MNEENTFQLNALPAAACRGTRQSSAFLICVQCLKFLSADGHQTTHKTDCPMSKNVQCSKNNTIEIYSQSIQLDHFYTDKKVA